MNPATVSGRARSDVSQPLDRSSVTCSQWVCVSQGLDGSDLLRAMLVESNFERMMDDNTLRITQNCFGIFGRIWFHI